MQILLSSDSAECADALHERLTTALDARQSVLWFMTGGSNITLDIRIMERISEEQSAHLTVTLTDERYGDYGHSDSNWKQLVNGGLNTKRAKVFEVLQPDNLSLEETTQLFERNLTSAFKNADLIVGFYGLGGDGHIAGILPHTAAANATGLAVGYETDTFKRITTTFDAIRRCDAAFMYTGGANKLLPLTNLKTNLPLDEQPAQILKELSESYLYNDQIGAQT
jgi:6-phosphogluconolactonase/glucosamine-6-phosphate isomerase/deaminase